VSDAVLSPLTPLAVPLLLKPRYAVDAETLSVRAFSFGPGNDINFSATVLPVP
jgi:hypothetical protein